jgi:KDO2-lipid IV(A) lauroyltransferase
MNHLFTAKIYGLYKPVGNPHIDDYIQRTRGNRGTKMISIRETRALFDPLPEHSSMIVFIADQSPSNMREAIWLKFLNRDTACLHGPEKYVTQTDLPAVFMHVYRVKRGFYEVHITQLQHDDKGPGITEQFMSLLEKDIQKYPSSWLWTHKRWKRRREEAEEQKLKIAERQKKEMK